MLQLKKIIVASMNSILKNKMRSLLTSLGIIIGVASVIVMVAIGKGASARIQSHIASMGSDMLMVHPGASRMGGVNRGAGSFNRLTFKDVEEIQDQAQYLSYVSPQVRVSGQIIGGGNNWSTSVLGVGPDYLKIRVYEIESGEMFTDKDERVRSKVAILGKTVADELFPDQDPIGEKVRINKTPFTVIGVLKEKGTTGFGGDQDDVILAPSKTVLFRLKGGQYIDEIYTSALSSNYMYRAEQEIKQVLRRTHRLDDNEDDDFTVRNQAEMIDMMSSTTQTMTMLLGSIAAVSLLVGGIGIMNIMLVSVTERTREIGIRLSIGARGRDIMTQFLAESMMLSVIGGLIGILFSFGVSAILVKFTTFSTLISMPIVMLAFSFACFVGVFFGYYPAQKAAQMNPIDALRYE